jgi:ribosomal protein L7/L12
MSYSIFSISNFHGTVEELAALLGSHNLRDGTLSIGLIEITSRPGDKEIAAQVRARMSNLEPKMRHKIAAIKAHREITGLTLKESKAWCDINLPEYA